jgi:hypothetical protein
MSHGGTKTKLNMKKEIFFLLLDTYRKAQLDLRELDEIGFNFYDGKYELATRIDNLFEAAMRANYKEEAIDWIFWFVFENDFGEKKLEARDGDKLICQTADELYDYITQYETH